MTQYIVTVRTSDTAESDESEAQMTVLVDASGEQPYVKEMTIRAGANGGLVSQSLAQIDPVQLARAFQAGGVRDYTAEPAPEPKPAPRAPAGKRTPKKRQSPAQPSGVRGARAYRRAPDLAELETVYAEVGTVAGVASHYDVPAHTAQGWVTRMRRKAESEA